VHGLDLHSGVELLQPTYLRNMKRTLDITVPVIPDAILLAVQEIASAGDVLHSDDGIEWSLFDSDGELIEVFWLEDAVNG